MSREARKLSQVICHIKWYRAEAHHGESVARWQLRSTVRLHMAIFYHSVEPHALFGVDRMHAQLVILKVGAGACLSIRPVCNECCMKMK